MRPRLPALLALLLAAAPAVAQTDAAPTVPSDPWMAVPEPVMIEHLTVSRCEDPLSPTFADVPPVAGQLSAAATLYAIPCTAGASRPTYRLYVHETGEIEGVHPTFVAVFTRDHGWQGTEIVRNVQWDADTARLIAEGPVDADGRVGVGIWSWGAFRLKMERFSLIDAAGAAETVYASPE
ncbi:hypothetical protein AB7M35_002189 [Amorphus suaedae]